MKVDWDTFWRTDAHGPASLGPSQRSRIRLIKKLFAPLWKPHLSLLDVGCGTGEFLAAMQAWRPWAQLVGADIAPQSPQIIKLDVEHAALPQQFDVVSAVALIDVINDDVSALRNLLSMVKPGGFLMVTVQHDMRYWDALNEKYGYRRYSVRELIEKVGLPPVSLIVWGWPLYHWYYRCLVRADDRVRSQQQKHVVRSLSFLLSLIFFLDDLFTWTKKGRMIVAVFQK